MWIIVKSKHVLNVDKEPIEQSVEDIHWKHIFIFNSYIFIYPYKYFAFYRPVNNGVAIDGIFFFDLNNNMLAQKYGRRKMVAYLICG